MNKFSVRPWNPERQGRDKDVSIALSKDAYNLIKSIVLNLEPESSNSALGVFVANSTRRKIADTLKVALEDKVTC